MQKNDKLIQYACLCIRYLLMGFDLYFNVYIEISVQSFVKGCLKNFTDNSELHQLEIYDASKWFHNKKNKEKLLSSIESIEYYHEKNYITINWIIDTIDQFDDVINNNVEIIFLSWFYSFYSKYINNRDNLTESMTKKIKLCKKIFNNNQYEYIKINLDKNIVKFYVCSASSYKGRKSDCNISFYDCYKTVKKIKKSFPDAVVKQRLKMS